MGMEENNSTKKHKKIRILLRVLIIISVAVAWGHSMLPAQESSQESGFVLELLKPLLTVVMPEEMVTGLFIRKLAHFSEYAILGIEMTAYTALIFSSRKTNMTEKTDKKEALRLATNTLFGGVAVALIDETIQIFSPGRGPEIADVWLDVAGFVFGSLIVALICFLVKRRKQKST